MTSSFTAAALRVKDGDASVSSALTTTSDSQLAANGVAQIDAVATVSPTIVRVRFGDGSTVQSVSTFASAGREKWEYELATSVTWNKQSTNSVDWTKLAA